MREHIIEHLKQLELIENFKIVYACESGSRAWGFASPDSDYDVRFIYTKPVNWYLNIDKKNHSITEMLPHDLDLSGWEIQKALTLFAKSNVALYEWLGSPIQYTLNQDFYRRLVALIPYYFNPKKAIYHYKGLADKTADLYLQNTQVNCKKLFYILRPLLACIWIYYQKTMPSTEFKVLMLEQENLGKKELEFIHSLLQLKNNKNEKDLIEIPQDMFHWIKSMLQQLGPMASEVQQNTQVDLEPLNQLIIDFI